MKQNESKGGQNSLKKIITSQLRIKKKQEHSKEFNLAHKFFCQVASIDWLPEPYQSQIRALNPRQASSKCN